MEFNSTPLKRELQKLENALKGSALLLTMSGDNMYTPEERIAEMRAIEELTKYIRNYDRNKKIIDEYEVHQKKVNDNER